MDPVTITLPSWLWILSFVGCWVWGGICLAVFWQLIFGVVPDDQRAPAPKTKRRDDDDVHQFWPRADMQGRDVTMVSSRSPIEYADRRAPIIEIVERR